MKFIRKPVLTTFNSKWKLERSCINVVAFTWSESRFLLMSQLTNNYIPSPYVFMILRHICRNLYFCVGVSKTEEVKKSQKNEMTSLLPINLTQFSLIFSIFPPSRRSNLRPRLSYPSCFFYEMFIVPYLDFFVQFYWFSWQAQHNNIF